MVSEATLDSDCSHSNCWCYRFLTGYPLGLTAGWRLGSWAWRCLPPREEPRTVVAAQYSSDSPGGVKTRPGSHGRHFG